MGKRKDDLINWGHCIQITQMTRCFEKRVHNGGGGAKTKNARALTHDCVGSIWCLVWLCQILSETSPLMICQWITIKGRVVWWLAHKNKSAVVGESGRGMFIQSPGVVQLALHHHTCAESMDLRSVSWPVLVLHPILMQSPQLTHWTALTIMPLDLLVSSLHPSHWTLLHSTMRTGLSKAENCGGCNCWSINSCSLGVETVGNGRAVERKLLLLGMGKGVRKLLWFDQDVSTCCLNIIANNMTDSILVESGGKCGDMMKDCN